MTYQKTGLLLAAVMFSSLFALAHASDIFNGRGVYEMHCQTCHGMDGGGHLASYRGMLTDEELRDVVAYIRTLQR